MILKYNVNNQRLIRDTDYELSNKSNKYLILEFDFKTSDWTGLTKRALFYKTDGTVYGVLLDSNNQCTVPWEVLTDDYFRFTVYGFDGNNTRVTTNLEKVYLAESGYTADSSEPELNNNPSVIEDMYNKLNNTHELEVTFVDGSSVTYNVVVKD